MMIIVLLLLAVSAFLSGFLYGTMCKPEGKANIIRDNKFEIKPITEEEYENFLKYDGSEQS